MSTPRPKVLAVTYGGGHAAAMAPVVRRLMQAGDVEVVAVGLTTAAAVYARYGVPSRGYVHYVTADPRFPLIESLGRRLESDVSGTAAGIPREETRAYMGACMADLIEDWGEAPAWERYRTLGRHAFAPRRTMRRIIIAERPDLIVATNSPKSERAALELGLDLGISTMMVPDLFCHPDWGETYHPFKADHFAVVSELARQNLMTLHGVPPAAISVTGQPALDKTAVPSRADCLAYVEHHLGAKIGANFLLVLTSPDVQDGTFPDHGSADSAETLKALLRSDGTTPLVIKPHPSETESTWRDLAGSREHVYVAPPKADVNRFLRAADGLLAASPTTGVLDAFALNVPTVVCSVRRPAMRDVFPWTALAIPDIKDPDTVRHLRHWSKFLERIPSLQQQIREEFHEHNREATARVADLITKRAQHAWSR
jgi:hypothetical protein